MLKPPGGHEEHERTEEEGTIRTRIALHPGIKVSTALRLLAALLLAGAFADVARAQVVDDPRGRVRLVWNAPEPGAVSGPAVGYALRTATTPPGSDPDAWWAAASPRVGLPAPAAPGTPQSYQLTGLTPGVRVYAALRAADAGGLLSGPIVVTSWTPSETPILQGVSPTRVSAAGTQEFLIRGLGLGAVTGVTFRSEGGGAVSVAPGGLDADGALRVDADLTPLGNGRVTVDALDPEVADHLYGWIEVDLGAVVDSDPPDPVSDLSATLTDLGSIRLAWTAPADPTPSGSGSAVHYEIRRVSGSAGSFAWGSGAVTAAGDPGAAGTPNVTMVGGLPAGSTQTFAVRTADAAGNLSALSDLATVTLPAADTFPPAPVTDLSATVLGPQSVRLTWSAPADSTQNGTAAAAVYDLRRLGGSPGDWSYDSGTPVGTDRPGAPGAPQSVEIADLPSGSAQAFALTSMDRAGNTSALSNRVEVLLPVPPDTTAPAPVADLDAALQPDGGALLTWTAPADDRGASSVYLFYRWDGEVSALSLDTATRLTGAPTPAEPGSAESWTAGPVAAGNAATFALASVDAAGNTSPLSNRVTVDRTGEDIVPPAAPAQFTASPFSGSSIQLRWLAPGDDGMVGRADHYEIRQAADPDPATPWWEGETGTDLKGTPKWPGKQEFTNLNGLDRAVAQGFALRAVDEAGQASPWVVAVLEASASGGRKAASSPPPPPDTLSASIEPGGIRLAWSPVAAPEAYCYRVYRSAQGEKPVLMATVEISARSWFDPVSGSGILRYAVSTMDADGNESRLGAWVDILASPAARVTPDGAGWRLSLPDSPSSPAGSASPRMAVFDVQGRLVAEPEAVRSGAGWQAHWDGRSRSGMPVASGIFFARIVQANQVTVRKILVQR